MPRCLPVITVLAAVLFATIAAASPIPTIADLLVRDPDHDQALRTLGVARSEYISAIYAFGGNAPLWTRSDRVQELLDALADAPRHGLNPDDYHYARLRHLREDSGPVPATLDILLTDALARYAYHLRFGKANPEQLDPHWNYSRALQTQDPARWMYDAIVGQGIAAALDGALAGFCSAKAVSTRNDAPELASRPFDKDRDGFVMGEGCGILILEELEHAKARGATIYAEVKGYGSTDDAFHITAPQEDGGGPARAMTLALKQGGVEAEAVDYINAHGTSTPYNDAIETRAIRETFGSHADALMVSSTKSMIGHCLGASSAVELVATALSVHHGAVHPTRNYQTPDPDCDLDYVPGEAREAVVRNALSNSLGFGGHNVSLLIGQVD